jgi:hypothetical protein
MNGCTQAQFELQKIKVLKGASGVEVEFNVRREDSGATVTDRYSKETTTFPHPDLLAVIESLKDILIKAVGKETIHSEKIIAGFKKLFKKESDYAELEQAFEDHYNGERTKITVTGIAVSGFDSNKGAIFTGTYLCKNGSKIALNSPRIRYEGEMMGFEQELQEICVKIEEEAYLYTFQDKQAQQQIVFPDEESK